MIQTEKTNIMVVDDQPANLKLLEEMLKQQGYGVRSFPRGRLALAAAAHCPPDLILLDINMPEINGFEVCQRLKSDPVLARIPVIFLSALNETEDKIKAFRAGGVDYVTKPFQFDEVQSRVDTHLKVSRLQHTLEQHNFHLEELVRSRTHELAEANARLMILDQSKSDFLNLISHEFRTPLNGLLGVGQLLLAEANSGSEGDELRAMFEESQRRILTILDHALLLSQIEVEAEKFVCARAPFAAVLTGAIDKAAEFALAREVSLEAPPATMAFVHGDEELLVTALQALLETAVKFSNPGGTVRLACQYTPHVIQVTVESRGRTVPAHAISRFFELFAIGDAITPGGDLGLDAPVAHRILSLFGGSVAVENRQPSGIQLTVSLQCAPTPAVADSQLQAA